MLLQGIRIAPKGLAADVADSREAFAIFVILVRHVILRFAVDSNLIDFGLGRVSLRAPITQLESPYCLDTSAL